MNADKEIELSLHKLDEVKAEIRADLTRQEKRLALYKECHKTMEEMEEIISISEFIDTLKDTSNTVDFLTLLVSDAYYKFSGIEKYVFKIE
jgi:bacterioferritin (cytochrome b1)